MGRFVRAATAGLFAVLALSCDSAGTVVAPTVDDGLPSSCSPLRTAGACMLPFPNAIDLAPDGTTATGYRVALSADALPMQNVDRTKLDPVRFNQADGFSPSTPILAYFPERIDPASLVPPESPEKSLDPTSPTLIVDMQTGALVPHLSEVDATMEHATDRQALILRPMVRLLPAHPYAVAIQNGIRTLGGGMPTAPPVFAAMMKGAAPSDPRSQAELARMPGILAALDKAGVARDRVLLAWDFVTASDTYLTGHVLSMRDQALAQVGENGLGYTVTSVEDDFDSDTQRRVRGTFTVPQFLSQANPANPDATISFDASGKPKLVGMYEAPFTVIIPRVVATKGPLPLVIYGHGLLGSGEGELGDATGSDPQSFAQREGYILFATDWTGLSANESPLTPGGSGAAADAIRDFNHLPWITDRLQQALVNAIVLVRTMRGMIAADPALAIGGRPAADTSNVYYYGISLGGIMGASFMGYDPDVLQGCVQVGGGNWSLLFQRSTNWRLFKLVIDLAYPDKLDQQLLLALAQMQFDYSDPINVAPHVLAKPLPGTPAKQILRQMAVGDAQVPNLATELIARVEGIPLLAQSDVDVWGLPQTEGPLPSAMSVWDVQPSPLPPDTNATPTSDNPAHDTIRMIPELRDQIDHFFRNKEVVSTCAGPCVF